MKNPSFDLNTRILDFDNEKVTINYFSSLCSGDMVAYLVEGITNHRGKTLKDCINNYHIKLFNYKSAKYIFYENLNDCLGTVKNFV